MSNDQAQNQASAQPQPAAPVLPGHLIQRLTSVIRDIGNRVVQVWQTIGAARPSEAAGVPAPFPPASGSPVPFSLQVMCGIVVDAIPHAGVYKVQLEAPNPLMWATALRNTTCGPSGATSHTGYAVGDTVVMLFRPGFPIGLIVGAIPSPNSALRLSYPLSQVSGVDFGLSAAARYGKSHGMPYYANGIPVDGTSVGEFGCITDTGMALHVDPFMAALKLNEITGLFLFYWDELVRLAGRNFQLWGGPITIEGLNDDGELIIYSGDAVYPWELLGAIEPDAEAWKQVNDKDMADAPWLNPLEPKYPDQKAFHRVVNYRGYLGFGSKLFVVAPNWENRSINRYDRQITDIGLIDAAATLGGPVGVRSISTMMLVKTPIIVPPHRKKQPNDPTGDTKEHYKPSGLGAANVDTTMPWSDETYRSLAASGKGLDAAAHLFNNYSTTPFAEHMEDFVYPDEWRYADDAGIERSVYAPDFSELQYGGAVSLPPKTTIKIDHRQTADIYQSTAYIHITEDGSIAICDGYGGEIRLGGGKIFINAPGGIFLQSGREVALLAGHDVIATARNSVDIIAKKDARLAANNNLHLAGALGGGTHGVLIESRSTGDDPSWYLSGQKGEDVRIGGIRIACPQSDLAVCTRNTHVVAHGQGGDAGTIKLEATSLNADAKQGNVVMSGHSVFHNVDCAVVNCFTDGQGAGQDGQPHQVFTATAVTIDATTRFGNDIVVNNKAYVKQGVQPGPAAIIDDTNKWRDSAVTYAETTVDVRPCMKSGIVPTDALCFTARTVEQYKTGDLRLPETRFAELVRAHGASGMTQWAPMFEISSSVGYTYVYPGDPYAKMLQNTYGYFAPDQGLARPRDAVDSTGYTEVELVLHAVQ